MMGYLYYGHYPLLYEIGRVEAIRSLGLSYKVLESQYQVMMPVISVQAKYHAPALYDDLLKIDTILSEMPRRVICFNFEIFNSDEQLLHTAEVKLVFVDMQSQKMVSPPDYLLEPLKKYFVR
jgi:acyl-CoA thioester hydrolase